MKIDVDHSPPIEIESTGKIGYLHADIENSESKLLSVKYIPENTLCKRWYLIQVDLDATMELNANTASIESYHYILLD